MVLQFTQIVVIQRPGADHVMVHTTLPAAIPALGETALVMKFYAAQGSGPEYVRRVFHVEPVIIPDVSRDCSNI